MQIDHNETDEKPIVRAASVDTQEESMDALKFLKRFLLFASVVLMLQLREVESKKSKIVFLPMPMISSQYFVILRVAEEMASRGHMVRLQIQGCYLLSTDNKKQFVRFYALKGENRSTKQTKTL